MGSGESTRRLTVEKDREGGNPGIVKVNINIPRVQLCKNVDSRVTQIVD